VYIIRTRNKSTTPHPQVHVDFTYLQVRAPQSGMPDLTDNTALPTLPNLFLLQPLPATPLPGLRTLPMATCRHSISHQHARPCGSLKHVIDTLNLQSRTLLVRPCTNGLRDAFPLLTGNPRAGVLGGIRMRDVRAEVGFAADKNDGNGRATDGADFFYPLRRKISSTLDMLKVLNKRWTLL
jgi:hypothetical protein